MDIPQQVFDLYNQTAGDFITKNFGITCRLFYGNSRTACPNCIYNSITKSSSNQYKSGGPEPFTGTICPHCNGDGYLVEENTEDIRMRVYWNKKSFVKIDGIPLTVTDSIIQTIGFITDLPKLQKAKEIIAGVELAGYSIWRYKLAGEILPFGLGQNKKFCIAHWRRAQ